MIKFIYMGEFPKQPQFPIERTENSSEKLLNEYITHYFVNYFANFSQVLNLYDYYKSNNKTSDLDILKLIDDKMKTFSEYSGIENLDSFSDDKRKQIEFMNGIVIETNNLIFGDNFNKSQLDVNFFERIDRDSFYKIALRVKNYFNLKK